MFFRLFSNLLFFFLLVGFIPIKSSAQITVQPINAIGINSQSTLGTYLYNPELSDSIFSADLTFSMPDLNNTYVINGAVYTNCPQGLCTESNNLMLEVTPTQLTMLNGADQVSVTLSSMLEGISFTNQIAITNFRETNHADGMPWQANLQILGDLNITDLNSLKVGVYEGSFTVRLISY